MSSSDSILRSTVKLSTGAELPVVGFGTWRSAPKDTENSVYTALQSGYRHIDCARIYGNEKVRTRTHARTHARGAALEDASGVSSRPLTLFSAFKRASPSLAARRG